MLSQSYPLSTKAANWKSVILKFRDDMDMELLLAKDNQIEAHMLFKDLIQYTTCTNLQKNKTNYYYNIVYRTLIEVNKHILMLYYFDSNDPIFIRKIDLIKKILLIVKKIIKQWELDNNLDDDMHWCMFKIHCKFFMLVLINIFKQDDVNQYLFDTPDCKCSDSQ